MIQATVFKCNAKNGIYRNPVEDMARASWEGRLEMNLRTSLTTAAILLAVANPLYAKLGVKVDVQVSDEQIQNTLQESMKAKLNSTARYTITDSKEATELLIEVNCLVLENQGEVKNGIVCASVVTYYPYPGSQVSTRLDNAGHMVLSGIREASFVVEKLLNHFMDGTTDSDLIAQKKLLRTSLQLLCQNHPNDCKPGPSK